MPKEVTQLHPLLRTLEQCVSDRDEYGALVGYVVLRSLADFSPKSAAETERRYEEVKAIYRGLEDALAASIRSSAFSHYCAAKSRIEVLLKQQPMPVPQSSLLSSCLARLVERGNTDDRLRRLGLYLAESVRERGRMQGNLPRIYESDYNVLQQALDAKVGR